MTGAPEGPARRDRWHGKAPIAVALDAPDLETAARWAAAVWPHVAVVKVGLELFCRYGPAVIDQVRAGSGGPGNSGHSNTSGNLGNSDVGIFLDLKLHDIPATVAGAARAVAGLRPQFLTVHASGGPAMIRAAVAAAPDVDIAAVTVLTSLSPADLDGIGLVGPPAEAARRLAVLSVAAGARALVCSPQEVTALRAEVGPDITLITPGIRPAGSASQDQARVATPESALAAGADLLVVGRPITGAADPGRAAALIAASISRLHR